MMTLADFSDGKNLHPVGLDGPVPARMRSVDHDWMRGQFSPKVRPGDVIYYYCSRLDEWDRLMGSEGYILVRDGEIVESVVVRMN